MCEGFERENVVVYECVRESVCVLQYVCEREFV